MGDPKIAGETRWEPVADEVTALVAARLEPVVQKVRDDVYDTLLTTVQDYLSDNLTFNIASRLASTERGRRSEWERAEALKASNAKLLEALTALTKTVVAAINAGDWRVDGACDPDAALSHAVAALAKATGQ